MKKYTVITLDGPAGVGKSTLAKQVAAELAMPYLDTGAMFRTIALCLGPGAENLPHEDLLARCMEFSFRLQGTGEDTVLLCNTIPAGKEIRTEEIGHLAARLATVPTVRDYLKEAQRMLSETTSLVAEGRDMGTVVFPTARFKFFLDADPEVRARRRFLELEARGEDPDLEMITEQIRQRDALDRNRPIAPLRPAADAVVINTSHLSIDQVLRTILETIRRQTVVQDGAAPTHDAIPKAAPSSAPLSPRETKPVLGQAGSLLSPKAPLAAPHTGSQTTGFSHVTDTGSIQMVDVGAKAVSQRVAIVRGWVDVSAETLRLLQEQALPKGDVLVTAQIAGIMAAKQTSGLIPLCHPVPLTFVDVRCTAQTAPPAILIEAEARTNDRTGVEMEALIAAQVAAATIYDMCKAVQKDIVIRDMRLVHKSGGRTGTFDRQEHA